MAGTCDGTQGTVGVSRDGWERQGNSEVRTLVQGGGRLTYDKGSNTLT